MKAAHTEAAWAAVARVTRALCIGVDSPRSLKVWLLVKHGEFEQLGKMKIHPLEYDDASSFAADYGVVSFLKKNADLPWKADTKGAAIANFAVGEQRCKATNDIFEAWMDGNFCVAAPVVRVLHLAQRKISMLLGERLKPTQTHYSWGPGATFDLSRSKAYPDTKLVELPFSVTGSAWKHACELIDSDLHWKEAIIAHNPSYTGVIFKVIPGGRFDTVAKTVLTDRSIMVEPRLNSVLQKQVGAQMRDLLKRVGVDLDDQSRNQYLASVAHILDLATLDLEMASDTVSRSVVKYFLPPDWFDYLDDIRSKSVQISGNWQKLEKFSSMGNGFTFELESLIFWALTSAASELNHRGIFGVYGDDIICHRDALQDLKAALAFCGFSLNTEKSFENGRFFESCGKHYYDGHEVTPIYQKSVPRDGFGAARMGNRLLRFAARLGLNVTFDKRVRGAWEEHKRHWTPTDEQTGPYLGTGDGYWEVPATLLVNVRAGPFGPEKRVASYGLVDQEIPAIDEAMLALAFQKHPPLSKGREIGGGVSYESYCQTFSDPLVSITGTSRKAKVSSIFADCGMIPSRVKPRYKIKHRRVLLGPYSTVLAW